MNGKMGRVAGVGALALLLLVGTVAAQDTGGPRMQPRHGHGGPGGPGGPPDPVLGALGVVMHELDLTDSQRQQIRGIVETEVQAEMGAQVRAFADARHALEATIWKPDVTDEAVAAAAQQVSAAAETLATSRLRLARQVLPLLDADQQQQFQEILASPPPGPGGPGGRFGGPPGRGVTGDEQPGDS